jgi:hypothetical protein
LKYIDYPLSESAYYQHPHPKDSIFLRDSTGHYRPDWLIEYWGRERGNSTNKIRSASAFVIGGISPDGEDKKYDGMIYRAFDESMWSHHLFIKAKNNTFLNQKSIGIDICNYGPLTKTENGEFYTFSHVKINKDQVIELESPFRGVKYFHSYSPAQVEALKKLLIELSERYDINLERGLKKEISKFGNYEGFGLSEVALMGGQGLWSHSNVRADKLGCHPHPDLIRIIQSL